MKGKTEQILKKDALGRVWTPGELREAVLDEFERSGMPATQFAARLGVKYSTFATWVQKRRRGERAGAKALKWVEAAVAVSVSDAAAGATRAAVMVELPGGARVEVGDAGQAKLAALLLRELVAAESRVAAPSLYAGGAAC